MLCVKSQMIFHEGRDEEIAMIVTTMLSVGERKGGYVACALE
jgi:hypothetical protein